MKNDWESLYYINLFKFTSLYYTKAMSIFLETIMWGDIGELQGEQGSRTDENIFCLCITSSYLKLIAQREYTFSELMHKWTFIITS